MTLKYGFYNSVAGDRTYDAIDMSNLVKGIISDGIFSLVGTAMRVTNGGGLNANVGVGKAWFNGTWTDNDAVLPVTLDAADALLPRIDLIVLEIDTNTGVRANSIKFVKGTPNSVPVAPTPITGALKNQYVLATCRVNAGATTIAIITDFVGTVGTPYITTGLEPSLLKASTAEVTAGVVDTKYVTPLGIKNSVNIPQVVPGALGNFIRSNGGIWQSVANDGWTPDGVTWTYSSVDGPTGIISIPADYTTKLWNGMRIKINQARSVTCYCPMDANSNSTIGSFTMTDTAMTYTAGKISNAATFNGTTSKIVVTTTGVMQPGAGTAFTLVLWLKSNTGANPQGIFQTYSQNTNVAGIMLEMTTAGKLRLVIGKNTGTVLGTDFNSMTGRITVGDNAWHYIAVTITRLGYVQIYVDGVLDAYQFCVGPAYSGTNYVRIGCENLSGTDINFLAGQIDDLWTIFGVPVTEEFFKAKFLAATAQTTTITDTKKAVITNVGAFSGGVTLITAFFGTDSELSIDAIASPAWSLDKQPVGFNLNPDKWRCIGQIFGVAPAKATPAANTFYGGSQLTPAGLSVSAPIGMWDIDVRGNLQMSLPATIGAYTMRATLANVETAEVWPEYTLANQVQSQTAATQTPVWAFSLRIRNFICFVKTPLSLNLAISVATAASISIFAQGQATVILTCAYL